MRRDYYAVLGIAATAPPREIRQAYRRLARQYSPDVNFWETTARTLFEEIAEAYRILSDPDARSLYDRFGAQPDALAAGRRGPPGRGGAVCCGDGLRCRGAGRAGGAGGPAFSPVRGLPRPRARGRRRVRRVRRSWRTADGGSRGGGDSRRRRLGHADPRAG